MRTGCRLSTDVHYGIETLYLENDLLKASILAGKGCEIYELIWKPNHMDVLLKTEQGLRPYDGRNLHERRLAWYSDLYTGGWQDVLPHRGIYEGIELAPDGYGIAATLPWSWEVLEDTSAAVSVRCFADLPLVPLAVEKIITLRSGGAKLAIAETVRNTGRSQAKFTWTQHPAFGGGFLDESVEIELPASVAFQARSYAAGRQTDEAPYEEPVGCVSLDNGRKHDMRKVPPRGPEEGLLVTMKHVVRPEYTMVNRSRGLAVRLRWDGHTFPHLRYWYRNGAGLYTVAIEPANDYFVNLQDSLAAGSYLRLLPTESRSTWFEFELYEMPGNADGREPGG